MADCKKCKHNYKPPTCEPKCNRMCDGESDFEPITNAMRIRSMSDEELAEFLARKSPCTHFCNYIGKTCQGVSCKQGILDWLQNEVE